MTLSSPLRSSLTQIAAEQRLADSLGVSVTPTVLINQWRYSQPPLDSLSMMLHGAVRQAER